MKFKRIFIQKQGSGSLGVEETLLLSVLESSGVPIEYFTEKKICRRTLPLDRSCLLVGDLDCIFGTLRQLKIEVPLAESYPECLKEYLHRKTWSSTLGELRQDLNLGRSIPVFAKPAERMKRFTGRVFESEADFYFTAGTSLKEKIFCSEVVEWKSEFRAYVVGTDIRAITFYWGDAQFVPDRAVIEEALGKLLAAGAPAGFALDFGVLGDGQTALVEMNEGFGVGAYDGVSAQDYTDLICARWEELMGS